MYYTFEVGDRVDFLDIDESTDEGPPEFIFVGSGWVATVSKLAVLVVGSGVYKNLLFFNHTDWSDDIVLPYEPNRRIDDVP